MGGSGGTIMNTKFPEAECIWNWRRHFCVFVRRARRIGWRQRSRFSQIRRLFIRRSFGCSMLVPLRELSLFILESVSENDSVKVVLLGLQRSGLQVDLAPISVPR